MKKLWTSFSLSAAVLAVGMSAASAQTVNGEVVKIEVDRGRITLKHDAIPNLEMDGMTMVFRVADPAMLDKIKAGDKIEFEADRVNGAITVTKIGKGH